MAACSTRRPSNASRGGTMHQKTILAVSCVALVAAGCMAMAPGEDQRRDQALAMMKASFKEHGQAKLDRLDQDEVQRVCSRYHAGTPIPQDVAQRLEKAELATIKYPEGALVGDWKA